MGTLISIVITILNEYESLPNLLDSLNNQSLSANEIILVDGGSNDNSLATIKKYQKKYPRIKLYIHPGNRSKCRNLGVQKSKYSVIAFTDAGCIPDKHWLKNLTAPFSDHGEHVVSGYYRGCSSNSFEKSLIPYVLVMPDRIPKEFFPSTRSMAISKSIFIKSGGFNEELEHNEDFAYANYLHNQGYKFIFKKDAVVEWIPRKDLKSAAWMFFRFALGDIQAEIFRPKVKLLAFRYIGMIYLFFLSIQIPIIWPFFFSLIFLYLFWAILKNFKYVKTLGSLFWLPVIQVSSDISILLGSLGGLLYRISMK